MANQQQIAEHLDLSDRQVRNLLRDGVLPGSKGPGGYSVDDCRLAYIRYLRSAQRQQTKYNPDDLPETPDGVEVVDLDLERAINLRADTVLKELKAAQLRRELAPITALRQILGDAGAQISALLETIPGKVRRRVPTLSVSELEIIKREVIKAQNIAARITVKLDEYQPDARPDSGNQPGDKPGPADPAPA